MALAQPHAAIRNEADWLTLEECAKILGFNTGHARRLAARWATKGLAVLSKPREGDSKRTWWIHRTADHRLSPIAVRTAQERAEHAGRLSQCPQHYVERAYRKARWVSEWRKRISAPRVAGQTDREIAALLVEEARRIEEPGFRISVRTLQSWHTAMSRPDPDGRPLGIEALVDKYNLGVPASGGILGQASRSAEALEFFYRHYRTRMQLSVKKCHQWTLAQARRKGWSWPASYESTRVWLASLDDLSTTCLCREGRLEWTRRFMPYYEQDWDAVEPGEFYVADHTECDFWASDSGRTFRPWLTAIQDCRSRRIVGWHMGPSPHQDAILSAMRMAFKQAVPRYMRIDNGRDFKCKAITGLTQNDVARLREEFGSQWRLARRKYNAAISCDDPRWTGLASSLEIELIYAQPYAAWSKGTVERFFRTFEDNVARTYATYTGNTPLARPEAVGLIRAGYVGRENKLALRDQSMVPTLDDARQRFSQWLLEYDVTPHLGVGIDGKTPIAVWNAAASRRLVEESALDILTSVRGLYRVGPNGVSIQVGKKRWSFGAHCDSLRPWVGRKVLVGHDPAEPTRCVAFDPHTRILIGVLPPNHRIDPRATIDQMRDVARQNARDRRLIRDSRRAEARRMVTSAQELNRVVREQAAELRATGTDGRAAEANIRPLRTGFEAVSMPVLAAYEETVLDSSDLLDFLDDPAPSRHDDEQEGIRPIDISDLLDDSIAQEEDPLSQLL